MYDRTHASSVKSSPLPSQKCSNLFTVKHGLSKSRWLALDRNAFLFLIILKEIHLVSVLVQLEKCSPIHEIFFLLSFRSYQMISASKSTQSIHVNILLNLCVQHIYIPTVFHFLELPRIYTACK